MAHTTHQSPPSEPPAGGHLPAARRPFEGAVEAVRVDTAPLFAHDLVRSLDEASEVVAGLDLSGASDVSVSALTALVCTGATPSAALDAAAETLRRAPTLEPHSLALARVPGAREGVWEWNITMTVSSRDPMTGEYGGLAHHADRPR
ncbi:hypothetical protein [Streptomyces sp. NBC_00078]|uniref:hypothetical protein n=1 Tax=Streptomyces sp. NBC_00078 TaxID=2975643 RepID=UPI0022508C01|nr:hypothetical protein [Streptomyces sp. NBC_00078]MCX5426091.1 hypothetical protein [Streptomyces sp. NBC_00078]